MKVLVFVLGILSITCGNPAADSKEWIWRPVMPMVTPNIRNRPFHQIAVPPKMLIRKPGTWTPANCGSTKIADPAIVNGQEATPHAYPWQAALFIDGGYFCGGFLISDEWVLTAAHCTVLSSHMTVVLGAHNIMQNEPTQVTTDSIKIITHEDYNPYYVTNDVGLVLLASPVHLTDAIQPVCLPSYSDPDLGAGVMLTATGWGGTSDNPFAGISDTLNEVTDPSISNDDCERVYGSAVITASTICTSTADGNKGTCGGDSGGPLNYVSGGKTYSRGVTSFVSSAGCTAGHPDGFTRTSHYLDWIEYHTGIAVAN